MKVWIELAINYRDCYCLCDGCRIAEVLLLFRKVIQETAIVLSVSFLQCTESSVEYYYDSRILTMKIFLDLCLVPWVKFLLFPSNSLLQFTDSANVN